MGVNHSCLSIEQVISRVPPLHISRNFLNILLRNMPGFLWPRCTSFVRKGNYNHHCTTSDGTGVLTSYHRNLGNALDTIWSHTGSSSYVIQLLPVLRPTRICFHWGIMEWKHDMTPHHAYSYVCLPFININKRVLLFRWTAFVLCVKHSIPMAKLNLEHGIHKGKLLPTTHWYLETGTYFNTLVLIRLSRNLWWRCWTRENIWRIMYALEWRTVSALTIGLFWYLFPEQRGK